MNPYLPTPTAISWLLYFLCGLSIDRSADFKPARFVDRYEEAVLEMLKNKQAGIAVSREPTAPRPQNVTNIMDALRRSLTQESVSAPQKKAGKRGKGRQGELLLPISGKKGTGTAPLSTMPQTTRRKKVG